MVSIIDLQLPQTIKGLYEVNIFIQTRATLGLHEVFLKNILQRGGRTNSLNISWAGLRRVFTLKESWFGGRLTCSLLAQPRLCKKCDFKLYFHLYVHFSILTPAALEPI